jgi:hypothetical protein
MMPRVSSLPTKTYLQNPATGGVLFVRQALVPSPLLVTYGDGMFLNYAEFGMVWRPLLSHYLNRWPTAPGRAKGTPLRFGAGIGDYSLGKGRAGWAVGAA